MPGTIKRKYTLGEHYVTSKWGTKETPGGQRTNYECAYCQFKTLDADRMNEHLDGGTAAHARHPYPEVDPEDETVKLNGRHPAIARKLAGKPAETTEE